MYLGMKRDELAFLAGVDLEDGESDGKGGLDDEDLRQDPISKIDMRVSCPLSRLIFSSC